MDLTLGAEGSLKGAAGQDEPSAQDASAIRIIRLSSWMMILGTVRLVSALGDYGSSFLEISPSWHPSLSVFTRFFHEYPLAVVLGSGWPLALGLILRKTASHGFLGAGAVTFFILSLGGFLNLLSGVYLRPPGSMVLIGSFALTRTSLLHFNPVSVVRALLGVVQLTLELATAISAWGLAQSLRSHPVSESAGAAESRRRLHGRLAVYVSLAFLVLNVRLPVWSAYLAVLNQSRLCREFVLKNDLKQHPSYRSGLVLSPGSRHDMELQILLSTALRLSATNHLEEARSAYLRIITIADSMGHGDEDGARREHRLALALNNLAWMLATCEDIHFRAPQEALSHAKRAVKLAGDEGTFWNTLGVAYFRVQNWTEAIKALERSMELRGEGDSYDWFFLAMVHAKMGQKEQSRQWYDRAVTWFHEARETDPELYRFHVEAAAALGLPKPPAPIVTTQPRPGGPEVDPGVVRRRVRRVSLIGEGTGTDRN
jgi:hypothetical protein